MEEIFLPHDLFPQVTGEAFFTSYNSAKPSPRSRITLDWHIFSFLQEGEKTVRYASYLQTISNSSFLFLPAGKCLMSEKSAPNGSYRSMLFFVSKKALSAFMAGHAASDTDRPGPEQTWGNQPLVLGKDAYLDNFIHSLELLSQGGAVYNAAMHVSKFEELMHYLIARDRRLIGYFMKLGQGWEEDSLIRKIVGIHMDNAVTVDELAFLCNMSLSTFKRKFARIFGEPPRQWFLKMRMQKAAELLKDRNVKASEIYFDLGYENLSSFVQSFKSIHGITPKQFQLAH